MAKRDQCVHASNCQFRHEDREVVAETAMAADAVQLPRQGKKKLFWLYRMPEDPSEIELLVSGIT
jgi:hypothetical protein